MTIARLLVNLLIPIGFGLVVLSLVFRRTNCSMLERLGLSFGLGLGLITLLMFSLNLIGIKLSYWLINSIMLGLTIPMIAIIIRKHYLLLSLPTKKDLIGTVKGTNFWQWGLLALISLKVIYLFFEATIKPELTWDAIWRHALIGKAIFIDKTFQMPFTLTLITDNPPFTSLAQTWIFFGLNSWNEMLGKIVFPLLFLSLIIVFYSNLRKYLSKTYAVLFTFLLSSLPLITYHANTAYADFSQTYFYTVGTIYLIMFVKNDLKQRSNLIISALFLGLGVLVKRHGLYLAGIDTLILMLVLFLKNKLNLTSKFKLLLIFSLIVFVLALPWFKFNSNIIKTTIFYASAPINQGNTATAATLPPIPERFNIVVNIFAEKMFYFGNWHLVWLLFLLGLLFAGKRLFSSPIKYVLLIIILDLIYLVLPFTFLEQYKYLTDGTLLNRVMMFHIPLLLLFCSLAVSAEPDKDYT